MNRDREITRKYVQHAEARGVKGLFITVDAPQLGRREKDMRMKFVDDEAGAEVQKGQDVKKDQGVARAISVRTAPSACLTSCVVTDGGWSSRSSTQALRGRTYRGSRVSPRVGVVPI